MTFNSLFNYLDTVPPLLLFLFVIFRKNTIPDWKTKWILFFIGLQVFLNGLASYLEFIDKVNLFVYHLNCFVSFILLSFYFKRLLSFSKEILIVILIGHTLFFSYNIWKWENVSSFNSNSFGLVSFVTIIYCLFYYLKNLLQPQMVNILKVNVFWFTTGLFTYYTGNFFIFITFRKLTLDKVPNIYILWQIHNVIFFIMCLYFLYGFLCTSLKKYKL